MRKRGHHHHHSLGASLDTTATATAAAASCGTVDGVDSSKTTKTTNTTTTATNGGKIKQYSLTKSLALKEDGMDKRVLGENEQQVVPNRRHVSSLDKHFTSNGSSSTRAHSAPSNDEKFKPEESIQYDECSIEQPGQHPHHHTNKRTTRVVKAKEKFENLADRTSMSPHNKIRRTGVDLASALNSSSTDGGLVPNEIVAGVERAHRNFVPYRHGQQQQHGHPAGRQTRAPKASSSERSHSDNYHRHNTRQSLSMSASMVKPPDYKLNPNAEEFTPRNFVSQSTPKIGGGDNSAAASSSPAPAPDNLMDFYNLNPPPTTDKVCIFLIQFF